MSGVDKDAETMALGGNDLPPVGRHIEAEETTRAVSRDELIRHQDAQLIVGEDADGDEATLAVAPGQVEGLDAGMAAALSDALRKRDPYGQQQQQQQQQDPHPAPAFPPPAGAPGQFQGQMQGQPMQGPMSGQAMPGSSGHLQAAPPSNQGYGGQQPQSWGGQGMPPSFDPMLPQGGYPPSSPGMPVQQNQNMGGGPAQQQMQHMQHMQHMQQQQQQMGQRGMAPIPPPPWMTQPSPLPAGMSGPSRFTPQVILLVAVGAVCLAIFIIGIVLFVTTKF